MISRIQTRFFRSLKSVDQSLERFQGLVGPNASGKTTFLDVVGILSDLMQNRGDVGSVTQSRSTSFQDLIWKGEGGAESFDIAVEAPIPIPIREQLGANDGRYSHVRYELQIGLDSASNEIGLNHETLWLKQAPKEGGQEAFEFFPRIIEKPSTIFVPKLSKGLKAAITKRAGGNDNYYTQGRKSYTPSFKLGRAKSALANIPADEASFPVSTWFRNLLEKGVETIILNSQTIRQPSPPGLGTRFRTDGSNLPWVIEELRRSTKRFQNWVRHVQTALPDIKDIKTIERDEDRHRYLVVEYMNGAEIPSWLVSDGTLRLLALTIPAYLSNLGGVFLIEEPENGIHPKAIETVIQSLSSMYSCQVLIATHSPVALNMLEAKDIICFSKDSRGATDVVAGNLHPALRLWKEGSPDLGVIFASGILS